MGQRTDARKKWLALLDLPRFICCAFFVALLLRFNLTCFPCFASLQSNVQHHHHVLSCCSIADETGSKAQAICVQQTRETESTMSATNERKYSKTEATKQLSGSVRRTIAEDQRRRWKSDLFGPGTTKRSSPLPEQSKPSPPGSLTSPRESLFPRNRAGSSSAWSW